MDVSIVYIKRIIVDEFILVLHHIAKGIRSTAFDADIEGREENMSHKVHNDAPTMWALVG